MRAKGRSGGFGCKEAADAHGVHDLVCGQMRVFEVLEAGAGDNHIVCFPTQGIGQAVDVGDEIDIEALVNVRSDIVAGVGHEVIMFGRASA